MKIYFSILVLAMMVIVLGCNSKKHEKTAEENAATEDSLKQVKTAELAERKVKLKEALAESIDTT